jgi:hypothetical protein
LKQTILCALGREEKPIDEVMDGNARCVGF